ncbi:hypothetical protein C8R44DRAFT_872366 [Mycena epipterygia]|nr:hypothetical protein C8R44DRAFT_872366 [Mycena epipterygia]
MPLFAPPPIPSHQFPLHTQATVSELPTEMLRSSNFPSYKCALPLLSTHISTFTSQLTSLHDEPQQSRSRSSVAGVWAYPPPPPPPLPAPAAPAPAPSPLAGVNTAVLALMSAVDAASVALDAVSGSPLTLLAEHLADVSAALENVNAASAIVCAAVSLALPPGNIHPSLAACLCRMTGPWVAGTLYGVVPAAPLAAVPDNNEKWFAITRGTYVGLTRNSAISLNATTRIKSGLAEKCPSQGAALEHFNEALACGSISVVL